MRTSRYLLSTLKQTPSDAEITSHQLMLRAGLVRKVTSGIYTWMPLGLRVLRKVEAVIRSEMNRSGAMEILMPAIQPSELWEESGRWQAYGDLMLKIQDRHERQFCFGPTHEEVVTDLMRHEIKSYKQLPLTFYQIQTKFRDELRPRFGVMRAREFLMKDAYSFHLNTESLQETYQVMYDTYHRIFTRLGLKFRAVMADTGDIGGSSSHEFQVLAQSGEDVILYSDESDYAANVELCKAKVGERSPDGKGYLKEARGIEVGHIFQLGDKYSAAMNATVLDETGKPVMLQMGCYGIGVSRIVAACIEQNYDDRGIIWPEPMTPFHIALVPLKSDNPAVAEMTEKLYTSLQNSGFEILIDDREKRPGIKFADMELIGIPHRIVISERSLSAGTLEYTSRRTSETRMLTYEELTAYFSTNVKAG